MDDKQFKEIMQRQCEQRFKSTTGLPEILSGLSFEQVLEKLHKGKLKKEICKRCRKKYLGTKDWDGWDDWKDDKHAIMRDFCEGAWDDTKGAGWVACPAGVIHFQTVDKIHKILEKHLTFLECSLLNWNVILKPVGYDTGQSWYRHAGIPPWCPYMEEHLK